MTFGQGAPIEHLRGQPLLPRKRLTTMDISKECGEIPDGKLLRSGRLGCTPTQDLATTTHRGPPRLASDDSRIGAGRIRPSPRNRPAPSINGPATGMLEGHHGVQKLATHGAGRLVHSDEMPGNGPPGEPR